MLVASNNQIYITRGDSGVLFLDICGIYRKRRKKIKADKIVFSVKKTICSQEILIQKEIGSDDKLVFESEDTINLPYGDYLYDVKAYCGADIGTIIEPSLLRIGGEIGNVQQCNQSCC